jgi:hypothetical protein
MESTISKWAGMGLLFVWLAGCATLTEGPEGETLAPEAKAELDELNARFKKDSDGDGAPDTIEQIAGTDPKDAKSRPPMKQRKVPRDPKSVECPYGWNKYFTICILSSRNIWGYSATARYQIAHTLCRHLGEYYEVPTRVATHEDLGYIYATVPHLAQNFNPKGKWLGNTVDDDRVLCGNRKIDRPYDSDITNFEGECNKNGDREYWCAFDLDLYTP